MSKQYTQEEMTKMFLAHVRNSANYWAKVEGRTTEEKLHGLAFSILVLLDGGTSLPGFVLIPHPHPTDEPYMKELGEDWWPSFPEDLEDRDDVFVLEGGLHELYAGSEES
jgi:hypothetical protein